MTTTVLGIRVHPDVAKLPVAAELVSYLYGSAQSLIDKKATAEYISTKVSSLGAFKITLVDDENDPVDESKLPAYCNVLIEPYTGRIH